MVCLKFNGKSVTASLKFNGKSVMASLKFKFRADLIGNIVVNNLPSKQLFFKKEFVALVTRHRDRPSQLVTRFSAVQQV